MTTQGTETTPDAVLGPPFTFTDRNGRVWDITLTLGAAKRVDNSNFKTVHPEPFSFLNPDKSLMEAIFQKPSFLMAIIWAVVQPQVPAVMRDWFNNHGENPGHGLPPVGLPPATLSAWGTPTFPKEVYEAAELEFIESIDGKALRAAREAFMGATSDFFSEMATVLSTLNRQWKRLQKQVELDFRGLEPLMEQELDKERKKALAKLREEIETLGEPVGEKSIA